MDSSKVAARRIIEELRSYFGMSRALDTSDDARRIAAKCASCDNFLYLGRQIALVDEHTPSVFIVPQGGVYNK